MSVTTPSCLSTLRIASTFELFKAAAEAKSDPMQDYFLHLLRDINHFYANTTLSSVTVCISMTFLMAQHYYHVLFGPGRLHEKPWNFAGAISNINCYTIEVDFLLYFGLYSKSLVRGFFN